MNRLFSGHIQTKIGRKKSLICRETYAEKHPPTFISQQHHSAVIGHVPSELAPIKSRETFWYWLIYVHQEK